MRISATIVVLVTTLFAANAHANEPNGVSVDVSYRSHILIADATAVALTLHFNKEDLALVGVAAGFLGGPAVHLAHGNPGRALGSLALRTGLTFAGGAIAVENCRGGVECLGPAALGGLVGYGAAVAIDAAFLARQTRRIETPRWVPQVSVGPHSAQVGVAARF